jgi:hypothetical protein
MSQCGDEFASDRAIPLVDEDLASVHEAALVGREERNDLRHFLIVADSPCLLEVAGAGA